MLIQAELLKSIFKNMKDYYRIFFLLVSDSTFKVFWEYC